MGLKRIRHMMGDCEPRSRFCSFDKPDPPPAPDYAGAAQAQGEANLDASIAGGMLNNPNIVTPYGSQTVTFGAPPTPDYSNYDYGNYGGYGGRGNYRDYGNYTPQTNTPADGHYDGGMYVEGKWVPQATITQTLSPTEQEQFDLTQAIETDLLDTAQSGLDRVDTAMETPFDTSQVTQITTDPSAGGMKDVADALYGRMSGYLDDNRRRSQEALLMGGHTRGGSAWDTNQRDLYQAESDAMATALLGAGQEQSRLYGLQRGGRQADIAEQAYLRQLPLNEINALRTGSQVNLPQFQPWQGQGVNAAPMFDSALAAGNFAQQNYQNQLNAGGGLFDLGGALLGGAGAAGGFGNLFQF